MKLTKTTLVSLIIICILSVYNINSNKVSNKRFLNKAETILKEEAGVEPQQDGNANTSGAGNTEGNTAPSTDGNGNANASKQGEQATEGQGEADKAKENEAPKGAESEGAKPSDNKVSNSTASATGTGKDAAASTKKKQEIPFDEDKALDTLKQLIAVSVDTAGDILNAEKNNKGKSACLAKLRNPTTSKISKSYTLAIKAFWTNLSNAFDDQGKPAYDNSVIQPVIERFGMEAIEVDGKSMQCSTFFTLKPVPDKQKTDGILSKISGSYNKIDTSKVKMDYPFITSMASTHRNSKHYNTESFFTNLNSISRTGYDKKTHDQMQEDKKNRAEVPEEKPSTKDTKESAAKGGATKETDKKEGEATKDSSGKKEEEQKGTDPKENKPTGAEETSSDNNKTDANANTKKQAETENPIGEIQSKKKYIKRLGKMIKKMK